MTYKQDARVLRRNLERAQRDYDRDMRRLRRRYFPIGKKIRFKFKGEFLDGVVTSYPHDPTVLGVNEVGDHGFPRYTLCAARRGTARGPR